MIVAFKFALHLKDFCSSVFNFDNQRILDSLKAIAGWRHTTSICPTYVYS